MKLFNDNTISELKSIVDTLTSEEEKPWPNDLLVKIPPFGSNPPFREYLCTGVSSNNCGALYPFMYECIKHLKPMHVVELGNRDGLGVLSMHRGLRENGQGSLTTVDNIKNLSLVSKTIQENENVNLVWGDVLEEETVNKVRQNGPIDFIFFDTLHTYAHMSAEWKLYKPLLAEQALVLIDDLNFTSTYDSSKKRNFDELEYEKFEDNRIHTNGFGVVLFKENT